MIDLSLIIPCFNEASHFEDKVKAIYNALDLLKIHYEIIFVDNGSRDSTLSLIKKRCEAAQQFRWLEHRYNEGRGKSVADGIRAAKGEVVGFIDIDLEVDIFRSSNSMNI